MFAGFIFALAGWFFFGPIGAILAVLLAIAGTAAVAKK